MAFIDRRPASREVYEALQQFFVRKYTLQISTSRKKNLEGPVALKTLPTHNFESKSVRECQMNVTQLAMKQGILDVDSKAHKYQRNDMAHELGEEDGDIHFIGPKRFFSVSKCQFMKELQDWEVKEMVSLWRNALRHKRRNLSIACQVCSSKNFLI